jgi:hypothetical protein
MGLEFVNPLLLSGVAAAAVPIVLHLIMRQQPRLLEFPALRFVRQRQESNRRRLRLRHLILLALRVAALCLLALAMARPSIRTAGGLVDREAPVAAALVFDTSPRMMYRDQNKTRLQAAQEVAQWLLKELPADSQIAVLESQLTTAVFQVDLGSARDRIERLEPTALPTPLTKVLGEAAELLKTSELENKEIYIFSDLSQPSWQGQPGEVAAALATLDNIGVHLIDVGIDAPRNFALGDVRLPSGQVLSKNTPLRLEVELAHRGPTEQRSVELYLNEAAKDDEPPATRSPRGVQLAEVGDGQSQVLDFRLGGLDAGTHQGWLRIVGEDALPFDDVRYFTIEVKPAWPVLVAAPSPAEEYAFFLTGVLAPDLFRQNDRARFQPHVVTLDELTKVNLDQYAAVFVLDPAAMPAESWRRLRDFAAAGGGVAIMLGRNAEPVESFNQPVAQEVLPGRLTQQARRLGGELFLAPDRYDHPLLADFRSVSGAVPWEDFPVYRYWQLDGLDEGATTVIAYSDGRPALVEQPLGQGRVLTMTTPISDKANDPSTWNLLPTGFEPWPFVMLTNGLASYLVGSTEGELNYFAGQTAVLHLDPGETFSSYLLSVPPKRLKAAGASGGGPSGGDEQLRRTVDARLHAIVETATDRLGNYRVRAGGESSRLDRGFSVNLSADASNLTRIDEEHLKELFGDVPLRTARNQEEIVRDMSESRVGQELFPLLILLVAVALGAEHVMANRFYKK